jgi:hypothetical protein
VLVKTGEAFKLKDAIDRCAALGALASVPAWGIPVVAMAMSVDPIITAIERDRKRRDDAPALLARATTVGIYFELRNPRLVSWKDILFANPRRDSQIDDFLNRGRADA